MTRRITITQEDLEAFEFLWGLYTNACEGTNEEWQTEEDKRKLEQFHAKFYRN